MPSVFVVPAADLEQNICSISGVLQDIVKRKQAILMRTSTALLVRRARGRNRKFRRTVHRICNRVKHNRVNHRMSMINNISNSAQSCDVISLLDDDDNNITNESAGGRFCGTCKDVQCMPRKDKKHLSTYDWRHAPRLKERLVTDIVDLSNDQEQASRTPQRTRIRKRKRNNSVSLCVDDVNCKKMVDMPATVVDIEAEVKVLGLDNQVTSLAESDDVTDVELLQQEDDIVMVLGNSCLQKTGEAKPTSCLGRGQDKPASSDYTKNVQKKQESNHSIIISDSDDTDDDDASTVVAHPKSGSNYIPLVRKRLDRSVEILEHVCRVPQSPELLVVKHIPPPAQTSANQGSGVVTMFEDRTGNFEQFYNANFWKKLKNQNTGCRLKKLNAGRAANAEQQAEAEPVKQRDDSNIYNPAPVLDKGGLRPVIIDGNNVAWGHGNHQYFSAPGLEICINYFVQRKHKVIAFVPQHRKTRKVPGLIEILDKYQKLGQIVMTPSRKIDGKTVSSYDDRYIVQAATELGGVIVSTDNFRDIMAENQRWKETIEKRLLMFTWVGDMLMFPQDPLGRDGPSLEEFLRFPN